MIMFKTSQITVRGISYLRKEAAIEEAPLRSPKSKGAGLVESSPRSKTKSVHLQNAYTSNQPQEGRSIVPAENLKLNSLRRFVVPHTDRNAVGTERPVYKLIFVSNRSQRGIEGLFVGARPDDDRHILIGIIIVP